MPSIRVPIMILENAKDLPLPEYATAASAGMDLRAAITETIVLIPGERRLIPTGIAIALPEHFEAQVRPRSGLALRFGIGMVNAPGTIDADYRGEIGVLLINLGNTAFSVNRGDRIAQLVVAQYTRVDWNPSDSLTETQRGPGGFGHTGK